MNQDILHLASMEAFTLLSIVIIMDIQETITQVIETVTQTIVARAAHILRLSNHNMVGFLSLSSFQVVICLILILWVHHLLHTKVLSHHLLITVTHHQLMEVTHLNNIINKEVILQVGTHHINNNLCFCTQN